MRAFFSCYFSLSVSLYFSLSLCLSSFVRSSNPPRTSFAVVRSLGFSASRLSLPPPAPLPNAPSTAVRTRVDYNLLQLSTLSPARRPTRPPLQSSAKAPRFSSIHYLSGSRRENLIKIFKLIPSIFFFFSLLFS